MQLEWFEKWFDSPYYHILYQDRNQKEAQSFIDHLLDLLQLAPPARVLDLACGQGRYSRYLARKGFDVTGLDLSEQSIQFATAFESDNLSFFKHDMRAPFRINYYDAIFNFFTSFGYFKDDRDDLKILKNVASGLKTNGLFVLDFFNSAQVKEQLEEKSDKTVAGIHFRINRTIEQQHVIKNIAFTHEHKEYFFQERVRLFTLPEFKVLLEQVGLELFHTFGNYQLQTFDEKESPRLILIAKKGITGLRVHGFMGP